MYDNIIYCIYCLKNIKDENMTPLFPRMTIGPSKDLLGEGHI